MIKTEYDACDMTVPDVSYARYRDIPHPELHLSIENNSGHGINCQLNRKMQKKEGNSERKNNGGM
jgi:hypothetical protein